MIEIIQEPMKGLKVIKHQVFGDDRGFFMETYHQEKFSKVGLPTSWAQDNLSRSAKGILRGLHFQNPNPQGKLVRVLRGAVWDVAVDLRKSSATFGQSFAIELNDENKLSMYVPDGFAHGFYVMSQEGADFSYKCTALYTPANEASLLWNDPALKISWPLKSAETPLLSAKDKIGKTLEQIIQEGLVYP